jgi:PAS domain S-box-containing protein
LPVGVYVTRANGEPYYVNPLMEDWLPRGTEPFASAERVAQPYQLFVAGTDRAYPQDRRPLVRALAGEATHIDDVEIRRDGGSTLQEVWGRPVFDHDGQLIFGVAVAVDIATRRAIEEELAEKASLLALTRDAIFIHDAEHRVIYWNDGAAREYGWSTEEAMGQNSLELLSTQLPEPIEALEAHLLEHGHWEGELVNHIRSGRRVSVLSKWVARLDAAGDIDAVVVIQTDITTQTLLEDRLRARSVELERLNVDLERSNTDLEQFAYAASHDLAEPLRAISGPVSLLSRRYAGQLDKDADMFIGFAVDGCERMQALIDDLLTYSRVGRIEGKAATVDVDALVRGGLLDGLRQIIDEHGAQVTIDALPSVAGEGSQLKQVFQNLIANAVKFARPGVPPAVHLGAERVGNSWRFTVSDNGIGIDLRHRDRVFGMFKRLHSREAYPGTGIGLALCKKIVERHGGVIGVEDGPDGVGSTFWFTLPIEEMETAA